ncbi:hybrid sensor histidine kinase/response regulator transcription factor [Xylanibacter muris]|uniref:histidine kinase n=1 Tax=Xylanibacter muris TaxID=2736290 RepID=A0ABX2ASS3_9BACT|nr:response regulator [Xylanibacter muris]NPD93250.1 response regulator [Xylanibacter muris]
MIKKIFIFLFFFLVNLTGSLAQPYCALKTFTIRDGLAANTISGFTQTPDGIMWIATWNGLCFYDGYHFTTFRNTPGHTDLLSSNRILHVRSSSSGNVWLNTYDRKVYMYDTNRCRLINISERLKALFKEDFAVRGIYPLDNGHTWLVGNDGTCNYRVADSIIFEDRGIESYKLAGHNRIKKVEIDEKGNEWVFTDMGLFQYGGTLKSSVTFEHFVSMGDYSCFASESKELYVLHHGGGKGLVKVKFPGAVCRINGMMRYGSSDVIMATDAGILKYNPYTGAMSLFSVQMPAQPSAEVVFMYVDAKKRVWAFTKYEGVVMVDMKLRRSLWLNTPEVPLWQCTKSEKPFIHEDANGTVWLIPSGGTFSYFCESKSTLEPYPLKTDGHAVAVLPAITKWMSDNQHNLWCTGMRDLCFINFSYRRFRYNSVSLNQEVRSLLTDSHGRIWAGSYDGVLAVFDSSRNLMGYADKNGTIHKERIRFAPMIYSLAEDSNGRILVGTKGDGLYVMGQDGVRHYVSSASDSYSLSDDNIYDIDVDMKGRIWIATYGGGLNLVDETDTDKLRFINIKNRMKANYPRSDMRNLRRVTHTSDGTMIVSATEGLICFSGDFDSSSDIKFRISRHNENDTSSLVTSDVMHTLAARDGSVYVVTMGGGIQKLVSDNILSDNLRFRTINDETEGIGFVQSLIEDRRGHVWIICEGTISSLNPSTGKFQYYGANGILNVTDLTEAKPLYDKVSDMIFVGARGGYVSFSPGELKKNKFKPQIVFTGVLYQGDMKPEPILNKPELDIPSDRRNLTIYFSAIDYTDKSLVRYAYMIEGTDKKWNYVGSSNSASFNRLPAGRHRLLVKSTNSDGVWTGNTAALVLDVSPTFWETIWAKILYVIIFVALIYLAIYIYNLRNRAALERELSEMKTRFFTDISHKLRTPLTLIGGPVTEVLKGGGLSEQASSHLEMVKRNASRMLDLVNSMLRYGKEHGVYISDSNAAAVACLGEEAGCAEGRNIVGSATGVSGAPSGLRLLIVEDNDDLRAFLISILQTDYTVLHASDGEKGLAIAEAEMPDFIITDVMMPVMDGLTMIHKIKQNTDICHIPIIVLSAKASLDDRLQGLSEGIDDYITKPFSAIYLKSRVNNIISQRRMLQQNYVEQIKPADRRTYKLEAPQIVDADSEMMKKLLDYLEKNISDANLRIEDLADAVNLGRTVFYGKIKSIVGMSPVDFVRHIRMQRAEELISGSRYSFSQIAYMVGFSDPKYFSRCFKKETGMTPSEYREQASK